VSPKKIRLCKLCAANLKLLSAPYWLQSFTLIDSSINKMV